MDELTRLLEQTRGKNRQQVPQGALEQLMMLALQNPDGATPRVQDVQFVQEPEEDVEAVYKPGSDPAKAMQELRRRLGAGDKGGNVKL